MDGTGVSFVDNFLSGGAGVKGDLAAASSNSTSGSSPTAAAGKATDTSLPRKDGYQGRPTQTGGAGHYAGSLGPNLMDPSSINYILSLQQRLMTLVAELQQVVGQLQQYEMFPKGDPNDPTSAANVFIMNLITAASAGGVGGGSPVPATALPTTGGAGSVTAPASAPMWNSSSPPPPPSQSMSSTTAAVNAATIAVEKLLATDEFSGVLGSGVGDMAQLIQPPPSSSGNAMDFLHEFTAASGETSQHQHQHQQPPPHHSTQDVLPSGYDYDGAAGGDASYGLAEDQVEGETGGASGRGRGAANRRRGGAGTRSGGPQSGGGRGRGGGQGMLADFADEEDGTVPSPYRAVGGGGNGMGNGADKPMLAFVEFKRGRIRKYVCEMEDIAPGQYVLVDGDRGTDCGLLVQTIKNNAEGGLELTCMDGSDIKDEKVKLENGRVLRVATNEDIDRLHNIIANAEAVAFKTCMQRCEELGIDIELKDVEYQFDMKKISFYFDCDHSVDFRSLVRELYRTFGARIWMENINPRVKNAMPGASGGGGGGGNGESGNRGHHGQGNRRRY